MVPVPVYTSAQELAFPSTEDDPSKGSELGGRRYSTSKLCNTYQANEFAKRIENIEHLRGRVTFTSFGTF